MNTAVAAAVDGARWVKHDPAGHRLLIWKPGSLLIDVVRDDTGEILGNWPVDPEVTAVERTAAERMRAGY